MVNDFVDFVVKTTTHYVREHLKDLLSLAALDDHDDGDDEADEDQETAVPLVWHRHRGNDQISQEEKKEQLQLLKEGAENSVGNSSSSSSNATGTRKRRASARYLTIGSIESWPLDRGR